MLEYRAYSRGPNSDFKPAHTFNATDDASAIEIAHGLLSGHELELWQGERLLGRMQARQAR